MKLQKVDNELQFKESASNYVIMMVSFREEKRKGQYKPPDVNVSCVISKWQYINICLWIILY